MPRMPFIAGNWKMNTTRASAVALASAIARDLPNSVQVGIAPPFVYLESVRQAIASSDLLLGAQDVYFEKSGAFTGEISVEMLRDVGVTFCLSGHSERRHVLREPPTLVSQKAKAVYDGGLTLVHCVGETIEQRDAEKTLPVVQTQLDELDRNIDDPARLVIAYEPVWAIGTGRNATAAQAQEVHAYIREYLGRKWNKSFAEGVRIQYGGSMKPENAADLLAQADVDGGLIGGASLQADSFLAIARSAAGAAAK